MRNASSLRLPPGGGQPESERAAVSALVVASPETFRPSPVCGQAMTRRKTSACSDRCRATKSRRQRVSAQTEKERRLRELAERILCELGQGERGER
jgi:predicted nucleic acid-binding Zn ribbon protein